MAIEKFWRPTKQQLIDAHGKAIHDIVAPNLKMLFVGINPGLYTAAIGHHFGRPGNRFWPALHKGGFTPRQLSAFEEQELLTHRLGITNFVARASARAEELSNEELRAGAEVLRDKVRQFRPRMVAFLGVTAYRTALAKPGATIGPQAEDFAEAGAWVLPNPSGLNAHYTLADLAALFAELRAAVT